MRSVNRSDSIPKKRRASHARVDRMSTSTGFEYDRKQSLQPKKKSKTDTSQDSAYARIFKRSIHKDKRVHTESNTKMEDPRIKNMMNFYKARDYNEAITVGRSILAQDSTNLDALYIVGLSSSMLDRQEFTINHFESLLSLHPTYKKNVYLFLSIAYKKIGKVDTSFDVLTRALKLFEDFFEAYVFFYKSLDIQRQAEFEVKSVD
jgi:tetratricopeptide (TPR) repeat protein